MGCTSFIKELHGIPNSAVVLIQIYSVLIGVLNIAGNAVLIWGLKRTRQTKTMSFQFIVIMSVSDLTTGILSPVFLILLSLGRYQNYCWMKLVFQAVLGTCNYFSAFMIILVAFDRYLHMKYLDRYSTKFTKRRGYSTVALSFFSASLLSAVFLFPYSPLTYSIMKEVCFSLTLLFPLVIVVLYRKAMQAMRRKANLIARSIINHNRTLSKAAKRISKYFLILTAPIIIINIMDGVNMQVPFIDSLVVNACLWFAYITCLANGFCSSVIFISHNLLIQKCFRQTMMGNLNRIRSGVGTMQTH